MGKTTIHRVHELMSSYTKVHNFPCNLVGESALFSSNLETKQKLNCEKKDIHLLENYSSGNKLFAQINFILSAYLYRYYTYVCRYVGIAGFP